MSLAATYFIWKRDLLHWWRDKVSIVASFMFPVVFLLVLGGGLNGAMGALGEIPGRDRPLDFRQYIFPGILGLNLLFISFFTGATIVADREFGILKEIKVAPTSRVAVALGKTLGGTTQALLQALLVFILAPLAGLQVSLWLFVFCLPVMFVVAFAMTSLSVAIAMRMRYVKGFQSIIQTLAFPLIFLSGAFFPLINLPLWLEIVVKLNPVSYAIDALRQATFLAQGASAEFLESAGDAGLVMQVLGHPITLAQDMALIAGLGVAACALAVFWFNRQDS